MVERTVPDKLIEYFSGGQGRVIHGNAVGPDAKPANMAFWFGKATSVEEINEDDLVPVSRVVMLLVAGRISAA
jgi:hypothetical protein